MNSRVEGSQELVELRCKLLCKKSCAIYKGFGRQFARACNEGFEVNGKSLQSEDGSKPGEGQGFEKFGRFWLSAEGAGNAEVCETDSS